MCVCVCVMMKKRSHLVCHQLQETRGGRSYKKVNTVCWSPLLVCLDWSASLPQLGYVRINLAEFAGAGAVQRKYLLESYNEHKHKPDNSILRVKVTLRQTSGDVLFKA